MVNAFDLNEDADGLDQLARSDANDGNLPKTIVLVAPVMASAPGPWKQVKVRPLFSMLHADTLTGLKRMLEEIEEEADAP